MAPNVRNNTMAPTRAGPTTRKMGGNVVIPEESKDIKDALESRTYCLHQISAMAGLPEQAINAIRASVFLLEELEEIAINETIRVTFDSQITEFTSDMKLLIEDANLKIDLHLKEAVEQATQAIKLPKQKGHQTQPTQRTLTPTH